MRDHVKLTLTGPPLSGCQAAPDPNDMENAYLAVLVTRHFGAMWSHMRQRLNVLTSNPQKAMNQVLTGTTATLQLVQWLTYTLAVTCCEQSNRTDYEACCTGRVG